MQTVAGNGVSMAFCQDLQLIQINESPVGNNGHTLGFLFAVC